MPDTRVIHSHVAHRVYGPTGPRNDMPGGSPRPMTTRLKWPAGQPVEPQSIAEHLDSAIARVPGLSSRQRAAIHAVLTEKCCDIGFLRMLTAELGPKAPTVTRAGCCRPHAKQTPLNRHTARCKPSSLVPTAADLRHGQGARFPSSRIGPHLRSQHALHGKPRQV